MYKEADGTIRGYGNSVNPPNDFPNLTVVEITDAEKLPYVQQAKIEELNIDCNQEILNGFTSSASGAAHDYEFNEEWQRYLTQQATAFLLDDTLSGIDWKTKDAGMVPHNRSQFIQLFKEANDFRNTKISRLDDFENQIALTTASTMGTIVSIEW